MPSTAFGPLGDSVILALTQSSQTFALGTLPNDGPALRLQSLQSAQTAWYLKFGTSGAVTVSVTDGMRVVPGGQDAPVVVPVPTGSTHYAILCEGASGNVLASYGGYDEATFAPVGASQVVAVTTTDQRIALPTLGTISPAIRIVATSPGVLALWVKLGNAAVTGSVTTSMKVSPGSVEDPTVIPVTSGETHLSIFCEGVAGNLVLTPGQLDHSLPFPLTRSGDRWGVMTYVGADGVMEIGRILDFHASDADTSDFGIRVRSDDIGAGTTDLSMTPTTGPDAGVVKRFVTAINSTLAQGDLLYYNGANFVRLAPGTSGQSLRTSGAAANPLWEYTGQTLLATGSVAAAAALDIVLTAYNAFRSIMIVLQDLVPATDNTQLLMRLSTNGGSSYDAGATDYGYHLAATTDSNAAASANSAGATALGISSITSAPSSDAGASADYAIYMLSRLSTTLKTVVMWNGGHVNTTPGFTNERGAGYRTTAQDTDAVRFLMAAGNITSANYAVYGWS